MIFVKSHPPLRCQLCLFFFLKKYLLQGSGGNLSLAEKTMSEILHKDGKGIELSEYEVFQDQIYDLLEPKEKGFQLKGLSKVLLFPK